MQELALLEDDVDIIQNCCDAAAQLYRLLPTAVAFTVDNDAVTAVFRLLVSLRLNSREFGS